MNETKTVSEAKAKTKKAPAANPPARPVSTPSEGLSKLKVGDTFLQEGIIRAVYFLNESRACTAPITSLKSHRVSDSGMIQFQAPSDGTSQNIGPNSELEFLERLGRKGLSERIDALVKNKPESTEKNMDKKNKPAKAKTEKTPKKAKVANSTPGIRAGKLGNYKGYSIASVIRTLAIKGWNFAECRAFCEKQGVEASDQTIKINIYRGVHRKDGEPAPLKPDEMPPKPKVEVKEKKAKAPAKPAAKAKAAPANAKAKAKPVAKKPEAKTAAKPAPVATKPKPGDRAANQIAALKAAKTAKTAAPVNEEQEVAAAE